jgi:transcriptional regulator with XRE-family HTH domain
MKERIFEFLRKENKTSAQFAEEIKVQPSGISHILSGRNKPSLDFVIKMLDKYPFISTNWLLFGKGSMYNEPSLATLFDDTGQDKSEKSKEIIINLAEKKAETIKNSLETNDSPSKFPGKGILQVTKIVWFYEDKSFEEYYPHKV